MITDLRPRIGDWDIALDGKKLANSFIVRGVDMSALPDITLNEIVIDGKPGSWFSGRQIGTRQITVRLGILSQTRERVDALESWIHSAFLLTSDGEKRLDLGHGHYVNAVMSGSTPIERDGFWSKTDVTFTCFDPYIYGNTYEIPLVSGENKINITGACPTPGLFEITNHSNNFELRDTGTGKRVKIDNAGTSIPIIIDMNIRKCTQSGAYMAADPTITEFWDLRPGINTIALQTGSGKLTYSEKFL